ncbi:hypothetical protein [Citrobacter koseri]|uniref:hypothetical protein n=1 Tax=Citrobacter koseri TaxID=545 RepID=UPI00168169FC|nr:hypothetical protein [Citrobacter koseri]BCL48895.1 hypothetical protein MPUCK001_27130 [Citrobacter koseri]
MNNKLTGLGANHPANGPLTTERLIHIRDVLQRHLKYSNGGSMDYIIADAVKAIDELLAGRKAEPVGYYRKGSDGFYFASPTEQRPGTIPLYAAPPAPVVPDEVTYEQAEKLSGWESCSDAWADGWNACRAAMLNGGKS